MAERSTIEWTDATWNPVRGCSKISPGCKHCYAERFAERFRGVRGHPFEHGFDLQLVPSKLAEPLRWVTPKMIFVNSMSDLFHERVPQAFISRVALVMRAARWHTYQLLTKRSARMRELLCGPLRASAEAANIWWGVSVENREHGLPRISDLTATPAVVRFLSIEPLLEDLGQIPLEGISWVIVGGESGPGARDIQEEWVLSIKEQCELAHVPFFFKQWGGVRKKARGRLLQGKIYDDCPPLAREPILPPDARLRLASEMERIDLADIVRLS
jgi:protein gp37